LDHPHPHQQGLVQRLPVALVPREALERPLRHHPVACLELKHNPRKEVLVEALELRRQQPEACSGRQHQHRKEVLELRHKAPLGRPRPQRRVSLEPLPRVHRLEAGLLRQHLVGLVVDSGLRRQHSRDMEDLELRLRLHQDLELLPKGALVSRHRQEEASLERQLQLLQLLLAVVTGQPQHSRVECLVPLLQRRVVLVPLLQPEEACLEHPPRRDNRPAKVELAQSLIKRLKSKMETVRSSCKRLLPCHSTKPSVLRNCATKITVKAIVVVRHRRLQTKPVALVVSGAVQLQPKRLEVCLELNPHLEVLVVDLELRLRLPEAVSLVLPHPHKVVLEHLLQPEAVCLVLQHLHKEALVGDSEPRLPLRVVDCSEPLLQQRLVVLERLPLQAVDSLVLRHPHKVVSERPLQPVVACLVLQHPHREVLVLRLLWVLGHLRPLLLERLLPVDSLLRPVQHLVVLEDSARPPLLGVVVCSAVPLLLVNMASQHLVASVLQPLLLMVRLLLEALVVSGVHPQLKDMEDMVLHSSRVLHSSSKWPCQPM